LHLQLLQRRRLLETPTAALTGAHEQLQLLPDVANAVGGVLELMAHRNGFLRTELGAAATVCTAAPKIFQDANLLTHIKHKNFPCRTIVCATPTTSTFRHIENGSAPEFWRHRLRLCRIRQGHPPRFQADYCFFQFAQDRHVVTLIKNRNSPEPALRAPLPAVPRKIGWPDQYDNVRASLQQE